MERARRLATRAILRGLVSESKRLHLAHSSSPSPLSSFPSSSRFISSLSPSIFSSSDQKNAVAAAASSSALRSQSRSISVEALKPSDTFPRRHNSATPEEQKKMAES